VAESSSSDLIIPGNYRTASARVELDAAAVAVPFNLLTLATSVSTESTWNAAVATERALMPSALTLSPRHVASASNPSTGAAVAAQLTDGATLAHDAVLPNELAVVLLRDGKKDVWTEITHKKPSRVTLTVTPFEATDRQPVEMQLVPADKAGVFRFDTRFAWEMLREAGKYSLTFSASGLPDARSAGLQPVAPLVITVTRAAVPKVRGLDKNAQWGGCTHRGQCEGTGTKCTFLAGALKEGKNTGVLDGAPMDSNLYLVQNNENMSWPADKALLVKTLRLEVWDRSGSGQRLLPGVTVAPLTEDDLTLAADGTDLILRNVRLLGNASLLPFDPDESTRQGEIGALLRVSMPNSKVVGGSTLKGGCEIEILVSAGAAASLVVTPAELGALEPGKTVDIQAQLLDARGNPTARGADGKLAVELAHKLVGLELDRERCIVDARARTATVRATVAASFGKPLSAEFSVPAVLQGPSTRPPPAVTAKSSGSTVARTLRLVDPPAPSAQVGAPFLDTEGGVVQVVDGDATVVTSFEGHLEISTSSAHQGDKHAAWFTALANLAVPIQQGCARLPALPPIGHIGKYTIFLSIKGHKDNKKLPLSVTVTAAIATRLEAVPPEDAAQMGVPFRLRFRAFSAVNNEVPVTHELANTLVVQSDSGFVHDGVQLDAAGSAALQLTFDCAPCSASVTASHGAHRLAWAVDVQPGPPVRARCVVERAESAGGTFVVRSGEAMRCTFTLLDAFDNECTPSAADVYRLQRQGVTFPRPERGAWSAELSAPEAAGDSTFTFKLECRAGAGRARTKWEALERDGATVECALHVLPSPAAKNITLDGGEAPLTVVAGKTLRFARVVVRSAEGLTPRPLISVMSLTMKRDAPRDGPSDPRLRQEVTGKLYAETPLPTDGAVFSGELQAPTQAGPYRLELENDRATRHVAVQVVADASGALKVDFINRARLPRHVSYPACVFAPQLDFQVSDAYGNPVDLSQLWKHCAAEVVYVRALDEHTDAARSELLPNVKNEVDPELLAQGIIRFKNVALGTTTWPSGNFRMRLRTSGQLSDAEEDNATREKPHTFRWTGQDGVQEDAGKKQLRLAYENLRDAHSDAVAALSLNHMNLKRSEAEHVQAVKHAKECDAEAKRRAGAVTGQLRGEVRDASAFVEAAKAQAQPAQCAVSQKGCPSAVHKYHRSGGKARLNARLHADSDVLCQVWELLRAETPQLRTALLQRCGHKDLGLLAVLSEGAGVRARQELGEGASCLRLDLPKFRAFDRGVDASRPQRPLKLPHLPAPGFVGYLVNLVHLAPEHLAWRFPASCWAGLRGLGLREMVLWNVFGNLKVFDTNAALQAFCRAPGNSDLGRGCCTLDGVMMQANAREHGSDVYPAPVWLQLPGVPWAERKRSTLDPALRNALLACEPLAPLRAEAEQAESALASAAQSLQDVAQALGQCRESHAARDAEVRAAAALLASAKTQAEQAGVDCSEGST